MDKAAQECWLNSSKRDSILQVAKRTTIAINQRLNVAEAEKEALSQEKRQVEADLLKQQKKTRHNRNIAIVEGVGLIGIITLLFVIK